MHKSKLVMAWDCDDILAKSPTAPHGSIDPGKKDFILRVVEKVIYNSSEVANYVKMTDKIAKCIVLARGYRYMHEPNAGRFPDFGRRLPVSGFCLSQ